MDNDKFVDESWKDDVAREKDGQELGCGEGCSCGQEEGECGHGDLEVNFTNYVMSMCYQAMIFLGEVPSPVSGQGERNLRQAKFMIDTLAMLKEKTKGNLSQQEDELLSTYLYELQMKFVELAKKEQ